MRAMLEAKTCASRPRRQSGCSAAVLCACQPNARSVKATISYIDRNCDIIETTYDGNAKEKSQDPNRQSLGALGELSLPAESVADDPIDIRISRFPAELLGELRIAGNQLRRISGTPPLHHALQREVGVAVDGVEHFKDREPFSVAAIDHEVVIWVLDQPIERRNMSVG